MAYEVTKRIGGRAYRYRVERVLDPETGKRRSRWTYLGPADAEAPRSPPRLRGDARARLLDALERLLAERDFAAISADAIAGEAGLAHGTFYRHFRDKRDAFGAALARLREERGPALAALHDDAPTEAAARAGLRAMVESILRAPAEHPALLRASYAVAFRDAALLAERNARRTAAAARLAEHVAALERRGLAAVADPAATAEALLAMLDGFYRQAVLDGRPLDARRVAAAVEVTERAVFGAGSRSSKR